MIPAPDLREFLIVSSVPLHPKKGSLTVPQLRPVLFDPAPTSKSRITGFWKIGGRFKTVLRSVRFRGERRDPIDPRTYQAITR
jgi:hypothetical protein